MSKISIIGAGSVGATTAFALMQKGIAREIVINDVNMYKAMGEALDLIHGGSLCKPCNVSVGAIEDTANSDIIVITAGVAQKPGETRLDLVDRNYNIFKNFVPELAKLSPNAILLVVSNPVDILTQITYELSGFPKERVIGSGTVLDSARLRSLLGKYFNIDGRNVHGYVLGEHGDSEFVSWSNVTIGNIPVKEFAKQNNIHWDVETEDIIENDVRTSAYEVIKRKGATAFSVATAISKIVDTILRDNASILTVSTLINTKENGEVYISVPSIVGRNGIEKSLTIKLNDKEQESFDASVKILSSYKK